MQQEPGSNVTTSMTAPYGFLILGLLGGVAAAIAGDGGEEGAEKAVITESMIEAHETPAFGILGIFGLLLLGRLVLQNQFTRRTLVPYFLIAAIGLGTLSATGHYGGGLVYEQGARITLTQKAGLKVSEDSGPKRLGF
ncbi:MAG TPA: hypothetical protein DD706_19460 [Nitrospiraceae bacterium]|nr:hypothetical protein [Nitrospiraceae bacterium]